MAQKSAVLQQHKAAPNEVKTIGDLLTARRKEAGLTQEKLSEITGIHRHAY